MPKPTWSYAGPPKVLEEQSEATVVSGANGQAVLVTAVRRYCTSLDLDTAMSSL